jgi:DNA-directed RNA polymerase subunit RPC12/RpoP
MIHNCITCDTELTVGENWYESAMKKRVYRCFTCSRKIANATQYKRNPKSNPNRMHVNGKYIPKTHPLHKAGVYKTFGDAAFDSLSNYNKSKEGEVYAIANKAWDGWIKIGMAVDAEDRLNSYQTSSPLRDYVLLHRSSFNDRRRAEAKAHKKAEAIAEERKGEWFKMSSFEATKIIMAIDNPDTNEVKQLTTAFDKTGYYK